MRSNTTKIRKNLALLSDQFENRDSLCIADIMKVLKCNRTSAYNYIKRLEENGYVLQKTFINNKAFYSLVFSDSIKLELISYTPMTADVLRKFAMIQELQNGPIKRDFADIGMRTIIILLFIRMMRFTMETDVFRLM